MVTSVIYSPMLPSSPVFFIKNYKKKPGYREAMELKEYCVYNVCHSWQQYGKKNILIFLTGWAGTTHFLLNFPILLHIDS